MPHPMSAKTLKTIDVRTRAQWRKWLQAHYGSEPEVWLVFHKLHTGAKSIDYEAAVEEALCFGWVDSKSRGVDDARTSLFFTPRKPASSWSESNVARVEKLEAAGLMRAAGRRAVEEAKGNGRWPA